MTALLLQAAGEKHELEADNTDVMEKEAEVKGSTQSSGVEKEKEAEAVKVAQSSDTKEEEYEPETKRAKVLKCSECSKCFPTAQKLKRHAKKHEGRDCPECYQHFDSYNELRAHKAKAHPSKFECPQCEKKFDKKSYMNKHVESIHVKAVECENPGCVERVPPHRRRKHMRQCPFRLQSSSRQSTSTVKSDCAGVYHCKKCDKPYTSAAALRKHHTSVHDAKQQRRTVEYVCERCDKVFNIKTKYVAHVNKHNGNREFMCPAEECDKAYFGRERLCEHVRHVHGQTLSTLLAAAEVLAGEDA